MPRTFTSPHRPCSPAKAGAQSFERAAGDPGLLLSQKNSDPVPAPTARFVDAATRLAGFAGAVLGWSPDVFWRATPAELAAVVRVLSGGDDLTLPPDAATLTKLQEAFPDG